MKDGERVHLADGTTDREANRKREEKKKEARLKSGEVGNRARERGLASMTVIVA